MKLKNQGFSVIGTLVGAGVGLIIMTALTQQMVNQTRTVHYLESKMEAMQLQAELKFVLEKDPSCDASFTGLTGLNVANVDQDEYTSITNTIDLPATPLRPITAIKNSYLNNRFFTLSQVRLFKPARKLDGTVNSTPFDFKLLFTVQEKGGTGHVFNVEGPPLSLTVGGSTVATGANACLPPGGLPPPPLPKLYECPTRFYTSSSSCWTTVGTCTGNITTNSTCWYFGANCSQLRVDCTPIN